MAVGAGGGGAGGDRGGTGSDGAVTAAFAHVPSAQTLFAQLGCAQHDPIALMRYGPHGVPAPLPLTVVPLIFVTLALTTAVTDPTAPVTLATAPAATAV